MTPKAPTSRSMGMTTSPVRFGIVGCGNIGMRHAEAIRMNPAAVVAAACDHTIESANAAAAGKALASTLFEELLASPEVDAVAICTPSHLHCEQALAAIAAGKHVIVEKPAALSVNEVRAMADAAAKAGVVCAPVAQYRFSDGMTALASAVASPDFGRPVLARASAKWFRDDSYYSNSTWRGRSSAEICGILFNQSIHMLDTLIQLFGKPDTATACLSRTRQAAETADTAAAVIRFSSGVLATLEASTATWPTMDQELLVQSACASAMVAHNELTLWSHQAGTPAPPPRKFPEWCANQAPRAALLARQYANFTDTVLGRDRLAVTLADAEAAVALAASLADSAA